MLSSSTTGDTPAASKGSAHLVFCSALAYPGSCDANCFKERIGPNLSTRHSLFVAYSLIRLILGYRELDSILQRQVFDLSLLCCSTGGNARFCDIDGAKKDF